jgi:hypothetical protein
MRKYCKPWEARYRELWDHARAWTAGDGTRVITLEPYGEPIGKKDAFEELEAVLAPLDIVLAYDHFSPYTADYALFLLPEGSSLADAASDARQRGWWTGTMSTAVRAVSG